MDAALNSVSAQPTVDWAARLQPVIRGVAPSGILEIFQYGHGRQGLIPLWVGESDLPTPSFIVEAAKRSLDRGETFYTHQGGVPELRQAIARYMTRVYGEAPGGGAFKPESFFVTIGGMHALEIAMRMVVGPGAEAIVPSPAWPNFAGAIEINGARPVFAPLVRGETRWRLDLERVEAAISPLTRAIVVNTPANPTGFMATHEEMRAVLDLARRRDLWIVADEVYGRLTLTGERAPSFHDVMAPDDRILFVQTCSKNWAMTGWRVGWLEAPPALGRIIEDLVQFTTSGVPVFAQRAATAALDHGENFLSAQIARMRQAAQTLSSTLAATGKVRFVEPEATFYLFFSIDGMKDTREAAFRLIDEAGLGLAPGAAFGPGGEDYFRLCFARAPDEIGESARRLARWLARPRA